MRTSRKDCERVVERIQGYARDLDLLPPDGELTYLPGSAAKGQSPGVGATVHASRNGARYISTGTAFLPEFPRGYNTTTTEAWAILCATAEALAAVVHHQESEHTK